MQLEKLVDYSDLAVNAVLLVYGLVLIPLWWIRTYHRGDLCI